MQEEGNPRIQSTITYELLEKIGEGGMGEVYRARLHSTVGISETVAIKKIRSQLLRHGSGEERTDVFLRHLERETAIISELNGHPNIVGFKGADYVAGESEPKSIFIVMEFIEGMNLRGFLDLHQMIMEEMLSGLAARVPDPMAGFILFRLANALDYAHNYAFSNGEQGIVHMDMAPGNVLINRALGLIKLADFGIASSLGELGQLERSDPIVGKPSYISPEVIRRQPIDFRSDIYSLGVIAYELLTGLSPNRLSPAQRRNSKRLRDEVMNWQERELIPPHQVVRGVSEELSEIVVMMMEFERENRFASARQLRETIGQAIYRQGYGPTDDAFAHYLAKVQILHSRSPSGRRRQVGRRDFDRRVHELLNTLHADQDHLRFYPEVKRKLLSGENPCRR